MEQQSNAWQEAAVLSLNSRGVIPTDDNIQIEADKIMFSTQCRWPSSGIKQLPFNHG